jgi:hypothetical protein
MRTTGLDSPDIGARAAKLRDWQDAVRAAIDRGCRDREGSALCAVSSCPICRPEAWAEPAGER